VIYIMIAIGHIGNIATALVVASVLLISVVMVWTIQSTAAQKGVTHIYAICMNSETREDLRIAMRAGIDQAMKAHTSQMFNIWMKDPTGQPERAVTGMQNAVRAYVGSMKLANEWNPPPCTDGERK